MEIEVTFPIGKSLQGSIWEAKLLPGEVRRLKESANSFGAVSVVVLTSHPTIGDGKIKFNVDNASVVNIGSTDRVIIIDGTKPKSILDRLSSSTAVQKEVHAEGDQAFLGCLKSLPANVRDAGAALLADVRAHFPGALHQVSQGRFQETPDNFWFATVQPRAESILITVRGMPDRFEPGRLEIKEDRRPYSRFKVHSMADVPDAARIIRSAIRRIK